MWLFFAISLLLLAMVLILKCYVQPKRQYNKYLEIFKGLGYKVHAVPFKPFDVPLINIEKESLRLYNDSCYVTKQMAPTVDLIMANASNSIVLFFTSPDLIKEYLTMDKADVFQKSKVLTLGLKMFVGKGLFLSEGQQWRKKRKIISKAFSFDLIKANIPEIAKICDSCLDKFESKNKIGENQYSQCGIDIASNIANRIMLKCFFGRDDFNEQIKGKEFSETILELVEEAIRISFSPLVLVLGEKAFQWNLTKQIKQFKETITIFNSICKSIVERRTKEIEEKLADKEYKLGCSDLLQALLIEKKRCEATGEEFVYTNDDIVQQFATFITAGTDTTSNFVNLMLYYICNNDQIEARLREEISKNIVTDEDYTYEKLKNLAYLECIQKQTSRHYGPATVLVPNKPLEDTRIGNIPIFKGTSVTVTFLGCHYSEVFYKDPKVFRPERWESQCNQLHPYAFVAFGGGPRACIGKQLAYLESKIAIIKIMKRYRKIVVPKEIKLINGFVYYAFPELIKFTK